MTPRRTLLPALLLIWSVAHAAVAPVTALDRAQVRRLVRAQGPRLALARARVSEIRAGRQGAAAVGAANPDLAVSAGPRFVPGGERAFDLSMTLAWPFDLSGAPHARIAVADARTRAAELELAETTLVAEAEALDAWVDARAARDRRMLQANRSAVDDALLRVARVRRDAGTVGDLDLALASLVRSEGLSRLRTAEGQEGAQEARLKEILGLAPDAAVELAPLGALDGGLPPLEQLQARLPEHPAARRAVGQRLAVEADVDLQARLGAPVPRLLAVGERSPEWVARAGIAVPLPVYARNQSGVAVSQAQAQTAQLEEQLLGRRLEWNLRAEYARWAGARAACEQLVGTAAFVTDAESLAIKAYELGQGPLATALAARQETVNARSARLDACLGQERAQTALELAAGTSE